MRRVDALRLALLLSAFAAYACNGAADDGAPLVPTETQGVLHAALVVPPTLDESCPGIDGLRVLVYDLDGDLVESADTHVKEQTFPSSLFAGLTTTDGTPLDELGPDHRFGDSYFVLLPGSYKVVAMAIDAEGEVHESCQAAETEVAVHAGATSEVFLLLQCDCGTGGVDVVVMLNCPPVIWELAYDPNKFVCCYDDVTVSLQAEDPDGDDFSWTWELVSPDPVPDHVFWEAEGGQLVFRGPTGNYEFRVTVTDVTGASSSLVFPLHVMDERSGCEACVAPPDCVAAEAWSWDCATADWTENVLCVDGVATLEEPWNCAAGDRMWVPSTGNDHLALFAIPGGALVGDYTLPGEGCEPTHLARDADGNAYVTCAASGWVHRVNQNGEILRSVDLSAAPYGCTALSGAVYLPSLETLFVGCAARGDEPGMILALNGHSLVATGDHEGRVVDALGGLVTGAIHGLATDGSLVFATALEDGQILAFDPATNTLRWSYEAAAYGVAVRNGWLWFTTNGFDGGPATSQVCRIRAGWYAPGTSLCLSYDLTSVAGGSAVLGRGVAVHPLDGYVWAAVSDAGVVLEIEPWGLDIVAVHHTAVVDSTGVAFDSEGNVYVVHGGTDWSGEPVATENDGVVYFDRDPVLGTYGSPVLFGRSTLVSPYGYGADLTGSAQCFPRHGYWKRIYSFGCPDECKQVVVSWPGDVDIEVRSLIEGVWASVSNDTPFQTWADEVEIRARLEPDADGNVPILFDLDVRYESPCP